MIYNLYNIFLYNTSFSNLSITIKYSNYWERFLEEFALIRIEESDEETRNPAGIPAGLHIF